MKDKNDFKGTNPKTVAKFFFLGAALIFVLMYSEQIFGMLGTLWKIIFPLILGGAIAYILDIIKSRLEKIYFPKSKKKIINKSRSAVCLLLAIVLILAVLFFVMNLVVPEIIKAISGLGRLIPIYINILIDYVKANSDNPFILETLKEWQIDWNDIGKNLLSYETQGISGILSSAVLVAGNFASAIFNFFIAFSFAIYLIVGKAKLIGQVKRVTKAFLPEQHVKKCKILVTTLNESFTNFFVGQFTEAIVLGALCTLGMLIFRFPYATAVGAFVGVTALIPIFGAWIGASVGALLILVTDPLKALLFLLFIIVLQQLENNLIYPRVVGTSIGLPGIWVLAAITIGGGVGGIVGMLVSVPLAATIYKLLKMVVDKRTAK